MPHPTLTAEEIARRGEEIYERDLRARLETEENRGKFLVIDIATGAYEIDRGICGDRPAPGASSERHDLWTSYRLCSRL